MKLIKLFYDDKKTSEYDKILQNTFNKCLSKFIIDLLKNQKYDQVFKLFNNYFDEIFINDCNSTQWYNDIFVNIKNSEEYIKYLVPERKLAYPNNIIGLTVIICYEESYNLS